MPKKKVPIKGTPDFTTISDQRLNGFVDFAQQMISSYSSCDEEVVAVMKKVWKQLSDERIDRLSDSAVEELSRIEEQESKPISVHRVKTVKLKRKKP